MGDIEAESLLKRHMCERENLAKIFSFTEAEGSEIVGRVGQSGEGAEEVRRLLEQIGEMRRQWEECWEKRSGELRRSIEIGQMRGEKGQINRDLDLLLNEIDHRRKNAGNSFEQVERNAESFRDITENMAVSHCDF